MSELAFCLLVFGFSLGDSYADGDLVDVTLGPNDRRFGFSVVGGLEEGFAPRIDEIAKGNSRPPPPTTTPTPYRFDSPIDRLQRCGLDGVAGRVATSIAASRFVLFFFDEEMILLHCRPIRKRNRNVLESGTSFFESFFFQF